MHNRGRMLIAASVAALALAGCGGSTVRRSVAAATVEGGPWFAPRVVTVDKGEKVILNVGNTTPGPHGFSIEGYGIRDEVNPGEPKEVKFVARRAGTFKIYCQLHPDTHKPATLVVQ